MNCYLELHAPVTNNCCGTAKVPKTFDPHIKPFNGGYSKISETRVQFLIFFFFFYIFLKKTFHPEKYFSPNRKPVQQFLDFILNFKMRLGLLEHPV